MDARRRIELRLGAAAWVAAACYFPLELIVSRAWPRPYSFVANTISDLGVTSCGPLVCSPRHVWMNTGFVLFGMLTMAGSVLIYRTSPRSRLLTAALIGAGVAGAGSVIVGLAPSNETPQLHGIGALLRIPGVFAPLLAGLVLRRRHPVLAAFSMGMTAAGVAGLAWFGLQPSGAWRGAAERLALDPFTLWAFVLGVRLASQPFEVSRRAFAADADLDA